MRIILVIILTIISNIALGQSYNAKVDSLIAVAQNAPDSVLAKIDNDICWQLRFVAPVAALEYGRSAEQIAQRTNNMKELCRTYSYLGVCERNLGNFSPAMDYYNKQIDIAQENNFTDDLVWAYNNIGDMLKIQGNYEMAIEYLKKAEAIALGKRDSFMLGYIYANLGKSYSGKHEDNIAMPILHNALNIRKKIKDSPLHISVVLKDIGESYAQREVFDSAKYYIHMSINNLPPDKVKDYTSEMYGSIAKVYYKTKQYDSAIYYANESLRYGFIIGTKQRLKEAFAILGDIYFAKGDYKKANDNYALQMTYTDSIYDSDLSQRIFDMQYTAEQYQKQAEIDKVNEDRALQIRIMYLLGALLLIGGTVAAVIFRHNKKIENLNNKLRLQKGQITDSINYAQKIQAAMLPDAEEIAPSFSDRFVIYTPRDIVGGDFYWCYEDSEYEMVAVADCTGHGVPGACMSMLGTSILHEIADIEKNPAKILEELRIQIKSLTNQNDEASRLETGMDIALAVIEKPTNTLRYSCAFIPLWYIRDGKINHFSAVKNPVGEYIKEMPFRTHELQLQDGDCLYLTTDGYCSQFGGDNNTKLLHSAFKELLLKIHKLPMEKQSELLIEYFTKWKSGYEQVDDLCIIGLRK